MKIGELTKKEFAEFQSWYTGDDISYYINGFNPCPHIESTDAFIKYLSAFEKYRHLMKQKRDIDRELCIT